MAEQSVVVEIDFCIQGIKLAVFGEQEWIDLEQRCIEVDVSPIQRQHESGGFINDLIGKPDSESELARLEWQQAGAGIDRFFEDLGRIGGRHLFDFHSAGSRGHEHQSRDRAIENYAKVEFLFNPQALFDQEAADFAALWAGLMGHELPAEHSSGGLQDFFRGTCELYASALAASAGVNLGFDHDGKSEPTGRIARLLGSIRGFAARYRNTIF